MAAHYRHLYLIRPQAFHGRHIAVGAYDVQGSDAKKFLRLVDPGLRPHAGSNRNQCIHRIGDNADQRLRRAHRYLADQLSHNAGINIKQIRVNHTGFEGDTHHDQHDIGAKQRWRRI